MREAQETVKTKPKNVYIRQLQDSDEAKAMRIFDGTNADVHVFLPQAALDKQRKDCKNTLKTKENWVVEKGKEVIGFISLIDDSKISAVYVKKSHINQGYGKHLLNYVKSLKDTLELAVYEDSKRALSFYMNQGFKEVGTGMDNGFKYFVLRWYKNEKEVTEN
jgi:ribosomal protein S18 acetylase RimI-like enzyme